MKGHYHNFNVQFPWEIEQPMLSYNQYIENASTGIRTHYFEKSKEIHLNFSRRQTLYSLQRECNLIPHFAK